MSKLSTHTFNNTRRGRSKCDGRARGATAHGRSAACVAHATRTRVCRGCTGVETTCNGHPPGHPGPLQLSPGNTRRTCLVDMGADHIPWCGTHCSHRGSRPRVSVAKVSLQQHPDPYLGDQLHLTGVWIAGRRRCPNHASTLVPTSPRRAPPGGSRFRNRPAHRWCGTR